MYRPALVLLCAGALTACSSTAPTTCTDIAVAGLSVIVVDSAGGQPLSSALVTAQAGAVADTAKFYSPDGYNLLYERPGSYDVSVTLAGYQPWHRSDVTITSGSCHVNRVVLTARLQP